MPKLTAAEAKALAIKKSRNGRGIFTKKSFKPNQNIFEVTGVFVTCDEDEDMDEEERANTFRYSKKWYISPKGRLGDMLNHSCEPNAKVVKKDKALYIVARTVVPKGAEVLIDYATIVGNDDSWTMHCNCGAQTCRKVVTKFSKLPKILQTTYKKQGMVPSYIAAK